MYALRIATLVMLAALSLCAATPPDAEKRIDELFRPVAGGKSPGAADATPGVRRLQR